MYKAIRNLSLLQVLLIIIFAHVGNVVCVCARAKADPCQTCLKGGVYERKKNKMGNNSFLPYIVLVSKHYSLLWPIFFS
jgi:hypothetical protein